MTVAAVRVVVAAIVGLLIGRLEFRAVGTAQAEQTPAG